MKIEQFFKEWISTRPNLKSEFHDAGIEAMAFAEAYHKKQCNINGVVKSLPTGEEIYSEGCKYVRKIKQPNRQPIITLRRTFKAGAEFIKNELDS